MALSHTVRFTLVHGAPRRATNQGERTMNKRRQCRRKGMPKAKRKARHFKIKRTANDRMNGVRRMYREEAS